MGAVCLELQMALSVLPGSPFLYSMHAPIIHPSIHYLPTHPSIHLSIPQPPESSIQQVGMELFLWLGSG